MDTAPKCELVGDAAQFYLSIFIIFGLIVSYLPQHIQIILLNSSEGINPFFLLLGTVSAYCNVINIIILQWDLVLCCKILVFNSCLENLLGIVQIALQWFMFFTIFLLYFVYYPTENKWVPISSHVHYNIPQLTRSLHWKQSIYIFYTVLIHFVITTFIALILLSESQFREYSLKFGNIQGIISMILASIQYIPQILETFKRQEMGALSIPMMMIQCPGALLFIYSIQMRPGTNWTSWITYAVAAFSQLILMGFGFWFWLRDKYLRATASGPIYIGDVQNTLIKNRTNYTDPEGSPSNNPEDSSILRSDEVAYDESTPILLNNHNLQANKDTHLAQNRTRMKAQFSKFPKVHYSLSSNLLQNDDNSL